jgi:hypothetical protein
LGVSYFRVFQWNGVYHALAMPGMLYRSGNGVTEFVKGPTLFTPAMRHSAVKVVGDALYVFHTNVGDNPERILLSKVDLAGDWRALRESEAVVVLEPEREWEGAALALEPSVRGAARAPVRQLRDPAVFSEDGKDFLLYSVAGEQGIAIARIHWEASANGALGAASAR